MKIQRHSLGGRSFHSRGYIKYSALTHSRSLRDYRPIEKLSARETLIPALGALLIIILAFVATSTLSASLYLDSLDGSFVSQSELPEQGVHYFTEIENESERKEAVLRAVNASSNSVSTTDWAVFQAVTNYRVYTGDQNNPTCTVTPKHALRLVDAGPDADEASLTWRLTTAQVYASYEESFGFLKRPVTRPLKGEYFTEDSLTLSVPSDAFAVLAQEGLS